MNGGHNHSHDSGTKVPETQTIIIFSKKMSKFTKHNLYNDKSNGNRIQSSPIWS